MKKFYSCIDSFVPSPNNEQHIIIKRKAEIENGAITAYASEEFRVANAQPWIKQKLLETKNLDGVIFFTAYQFLYGKTFNFKLFKHILNDLSLEIHFARENLSFRKNEPNWEERLSYLICYSQIFQRENNDNLNFYKKIFNNC